MIAPGCRARLVGELPLARARSAGEKTAAATGNGLMGAEGAHTGDAAVEADIMKGPDETGKPAAACKPRALGQPREEETAHARTAKSTVPLDPRGVTIEACHYRNRP